MAGVIYAPICLAAAAMFDSLRSMLLEPMFGAISSRQLETPLQTRRSASRPNTVKDVYDESDDCGVASIMNFRIEYLTETTREDSVCHSIIAHGHTLDTVEAEAFAHADAAKAHGATGFQVRHLNAADKVVAIKNFSDPV
jgi:hypothetical protein